MLTGLTHGPTADTEKLEITLRATAARNKGDVVYVDIDNLGFCDLTVASNAAIHYAVVADGNYVSGQQGTYILRGPCTITAPSATYTANDALLITTGAIATASPFPVAGVAGQAQTNFGCIRNTVTGTSVDIFLHGCPFTSS